MRKVHQRQSQITARRILDEAPTTENGSYAIEQKQDYRYDAGCIHGYIILIIPLKMRIILYLFLYLIKWITDNGNHQSDAGKDKSNSSCDNSVQNEFWIRVRHLQV
jgi:hypothetical protein